MRTECLCISVLRVTSGPRIKLPGRKKCFNPSVIYSTDRSKALVPVLVLLSVAFWFILRGDLFEVLPYVILFLCFSVLLALRLPRVGERELILVFFVRFCSICSCLSLSFGVWDGLRLVIVALPGLFSYFLFYQLLCPILDAVFPMDIFLSYF